MRDLLRFVFGTGWWVPWHLVLLLLLWPLWGMEKYMRAYQPGKGPQGGEAATLFLLLLFMALAGGAVVNGLLLAASLSGSWAMRFLVWGPAFAGALSLIAAAILYLITLAASEDMKLLTTSRSLLRLGLLLALLVVYYGASLCALARFEGMRLEVRSEK